MKRLSILLAVLALAACGTTNRSTVKDGNKNVSYEQRDGISAAIVLEQQ